jgi:2-keto-4-pentenoate hydratase/2-oxohepta-3-ene-1,7-dioic acid hydratase in catechol pathway
MRLVSFDEGYRLGIVDGEELYDVTDVVASSPSGFSLMRQAIAQWAHLRPEIERVLPGLRSRSLRSVRLRAPLPDPPKILGAGANYRAHTAEMGDLDPVYQHGIYGIGVYVCAPSAVTDPTGEIVIPAFYRDRRVDHEIELAVIIGKPGRYIRREEAEAYIFGYTGLLDITLRGKELTSFRKSFDTFKPMGPMIVTRDELPDPRSVRLRLWVNDELRQDEMVGTMVYGIPEILEFVSARMTLQPGDIVTTGTPAGVGPLKGGDVVRAQFEGIGEMLLRVRYSNEVE